MRQNATPPESLGGAVDVAKPHRVAETRVDPLCAGFLECNNPVVRGLLMGGGFLAGWGLLQVLSCWEKESGGVNAWVYAL